MLLSWYYLHGLVLPLVTLFPLPLLLPLVFPYSMVFVFPHDRCWNYQFRCQVGTTCMDYAVLTVLTTIDVCFYCMSVFFALFTSEYKLWIVTPHVCRALI